MVTITELRTMTKDADPAVREAASNEIRRRYEILFTDATYFGQSIKNMGMALELYGYIASSTIKEFFRRYSASEHVEDLADYLRDIPAVYSKFNERVEFPLSDASAPAGKLEELYRANTWPEHQNYRPELGGLTNYLTCINRPDYDLNSEYYNYLEFMCTPRIDSPKIVKEVHRSSDALKENIMRLINNLHKKLLVPRSIMGHVVPEIKYVNKLIKIWDNYAVVYGGQTRLVRKPYPVQQIQQQQQEQRLQEQERLSDPRHGYQQYQLDQDEQQEQLTEQQYLARQIQERAQERNRYLERYQNQDRDRDPRDDTYDQFERRQERLLQARAIAQDRQLAEPEGHSIGPQDSEFVQYEQTEEKYAERKNKIVAGPTSDCNFGQMVTDRNLFPVLTRADIICEIEKYRLVQGKGVLDEFKNRKHGTQKSIPINLEGKDLFFKLLSLPIHDGYYRFMGTHAADLGGVSRQVFTMAGKYIQDNFLTRRGNRYYFTSLKKGAGKAVAHVLRLALTQGMVLGIPLSYGILYCIREGMVPDLDNMTFEQLIYLYWKDHDKCNESLTSILSPYYWNGGGDSEDIKEPSQVMGYMLNTETLSADDRLEWIRRYLFGYLFGTTRDGRLVRNKELESFLAPAGMWSKKLQPLIKTAALDNIADITGPSVDAESVYSLINGLKANPTIDGYMKRYLTESPSENLRKFLIFVTGAVDLTQSIKVWIYNRDGLPSSHTCSRELEINRDYKDYESFLKDFNLALSEEGFGFV
jgi:hypothetical protein